MFEHLNKHTNITDNRKSGWYMYAWSVTTDVHPVVEGQQHCRGVNPQRLGAWRQP